MLARCAGAVVPSERTLPILKASNTPRARALPSVAQLRRGITQIPPTSVAVSDGARRNLAGPGDDVLLG